MPQLPNSNFFINRSVTSPAVTVKPKFNFKEYDFKAEHGNKFALITLNDTKQASNTDIKANAPKFSVYIGNGTEPFQSSDGKKIAVFDTQDDNQPSIAAQFHVTSLTNISTKNLFETPGEDLKNVSAIKGKADVIQLHGNQMVIINAGAVSKNSNGFKTSVPGGVHIYAGDRDSEGASQAQPMVLGNNLKTALEEIYQTLQSLSSNISDINLEIMQMKVGLMVHFHPPLAPPSPTLIAQFSPTLITNDLRRTLNSYADMINHQLEKINRVLPITNQVITSAYNTVN